MQNGAGHLNDDDWEADGDQEEDEPDKMVLVFVGMPSRHYAGLQAIAEREDVSFSYVVNDALELHILSDRYIQEYGEVEP